MKCLRAVVLVFLTLLQGAHAEAPLQFVEIPELTRRIVDTTGVLGADQRALEHQLEVLKQEKGSEVAVLILPSTKPETIEQYSIRVVEKWKLGRHGVDDGALLLVALQDRSVRIEIGRGLEGEIPDLVAHRIIDEQILPRFRDGKIVAGVQAGIDCIERKIRGTELPPAVASGGADIGAVLPIFFFAYGLGVAFTALFGRGFGALLGGGFGFAVTLLVLPIAVAALVALVSALFVLFSPELTASRIGVGSGAGGWSGRGPSGFGSFGGGSFGGGGGFSGGGASGRW